MYHLEVVKSLENRQVVVPELDRSIKHQPGLLRVLAKLHSLDYMLSELDLLLVKNLLLLLCELAVVLVILQRHQILMTNLDILLQQELHVALCQLDVAIRLGDHEVSILLRVPLLSDAKRCSSERQLNQHFVHSKRGDL